MCFILINSRCSNKDGSASCLDVIKGHLNYTTWDQVKDQCPNKLEAKKSAGRTLVVTNFRTLHLLHMHPYLPFEDFVTEGRLANPTIFKNALKMDLLETIEELKRSRGSGTVVYRTINAACEELYTDLWKNATNGYKMGRTVRMKINGVYAVFEKRSTCDDYVKTSLQGDQNSWGEEGPCYGTMLASTGADFFYKLELEVAQEVKEAVGEDGPVQFHLLDAMKITKPNCDKTTDGRHFHKINYAQLHVLAKGLNNVG